MTIYLLFYTKFWPATKLNPQKLIPVTKSYYDYVIYNVKQEKKVHIQEVYYEREEHL